ncbi:MAG TPA: signal recognition particle protein [Candidatus Mcinerneyibacteriales bacterium]|nr:signal recognition particle protein [Candidatus Mcinerneyibacteriales bacterium]HPJ69534.1 signal recognition particle protein [Candidatus Mcinerneyibacteriales bacterium]
MFDSLSAKLDAVFKKLSRHGILRPEDVKTGLREIRIALLEADVHYKVVKEFIQNVESRAVGEAVLKSLTPAQQIVRIVRDEMLAVLGKPAPVDTSVSPAIIMLVGLQGSGKTTAAAKIAKKFKKEGLKPFLIAADLQRPAAIDQLEHLAREIGVGIYADKESKDVGKVARQGVEAGKRSFAKVIILDTAGRLQIDGALMDELDILQKSIRPQETLLVVDAMAGQDAVNVASGFQEKIGIDGVIFTKVDSDARGGALLSLRMVTGKPVKFIGVGEKSDDLETFQPERMVSRILGMGDVLTLIEKAEEQWTEEEARDMEAKFLKAQFTLEDFMKQIKMIKKMGSLSTLLKMIPGVPRDLDVDEKQLVRVESIIQSMTPRERQYPGIIKASRKKRIARGSGRSVAEVNQLLRQYEMSKKMMKKLGKGGQNAGIPGLFQ